MKSRFWESWDKNEIETITQMWPTSSAREIGNIIGRSRNAVIGKAQRLCLIRKHGGHPIPDTAEAIAFEVDRMLTRLGSKIRIKEKDKLSRLVITYLKETK